MTDRIEIEQDYDSDGDDLGSPINSFWSLGHGHTASALRGVCGAAWPVCDEWMGVPDDESPWCPRCGWTRHLHPGQTP